MLRGKLGLWIRKMIVRIGSYDWQTARFILGMVRARNASIGNAETSWRNAHWMVVGGSAVDRRLHYLHYLRRDDE